MTCRYDSTEWLGVLYPSDRNTPGGVADAANHLTIRRGKNITPESLRLRLRGVGDSRLSMEMFELLIEWMQEKAEGEVYALDALHALNARFGLVAEHVEDHVADDASEPGTLRLVSTAMHLQAHVGLIVDDVKRALADQRIDDHDAEKIIATGRRGQRLFQRLIHAARNSPHVAAVVMERFKAGMGCCRPEREQIGLCCSSGQQLACAVTTLASRFECAPADAGRLLSELIATFPHRLAPVLAEANEAGRVRLFVERAARTCVALATKAERHAFRDQLTDRLCALDLTAFDDLMSAEWRRLRGK